MHKFISYYYYTHTHTHKILRIRHTHMLFTLRIMSMQRFLGLTLGTPTFVPT